MKLDLKDLNEDLAKNFKERLAFVKFWADYIKKIDDKKWSSAQRDLIDSQFTRSG